VISVISTLISTLVGLLGGWLISRYFHLKGSEESKQQLQEIKDYIATMLRQLEAQGDVRVRRSEGGEITDVQIIRPEGVPSEEAFGEPTVVSLGPPPRGIELEGVLGGRGGMSGDLTVGRRPW
jgi:hypothetical protein